MDNVRYEKNHVCQSGNHDECYTVTYDVFDGDDFAGMVTYWRESATWTTENDLWRTLAGVSESRDQAAALLFGN